MVRTKGLYYGMLKLVDKKLFRILCSIFCLTVPLNSSKMCLFWPEKRWGYSIIVGHPEPEKKSVGIFEYILASMLKVYLDVF